MERVRDAGGALEGAVSGMRQDFSHVAVTVPRSCLQGAPRARLLQFYERVFGWSENERLGIAGERIFVRAPTDRQYLTVRASDAPMKTSGYEHLGVLVDTPEDVRTLHERASAEAARDTEVEVGDVRVLYGGHLHTFRVRYLLPLTIEVQCLVDAP